MLHCDDAAQRNANEFKMLLFTYTLYINPQILNVMFLYQNIINYYVNKKMKQKWIKC